MKIVYKGEAVHDLQATADYVRVELKNPTAARKLTTKILRAVSLLSENPHMGSLLSEKFDISSDLRYFIVMKYIVFYRLRSDKIEIIRILDGRRDYMALLFP